MSIQSFRRKPRNRPCPRRFLTITLGLLMIMVICGNETKGGATMTMQLSSPAFSARGAIPRLYTCDGDDISPPLGWRGLPPDTKSLALIVDDPDAPDPKAPKRTWVHWLLYNLPVGTDRLEENVGDTGLPAGTLSGLNDWGRPGYGGPCPPIGRHRYFFKLYALDIQLPDLGQPRKGELLQAMQDHILANAELVGTYQR
jgi:Raf kinase inhibitor-like YbhB/YbcL family protein